MIGHVHVQIIYGLLFRVFRVGCPDLPSRKEVSTINLDYPAWLVLS